MDRKVIYLSAYRILILEKAKFLRVVLSDNLSVKTYLQPEVFDEPDANFTKENIVKFIKRRRNVADLIIINYHLADSTLNQIREEIREIVKIPIICLTSDDDKKHIKELMEKDENAFYIQKVALNDMIGKITKVIDYILDIKEDVSTLLETPENNKTE